MLFILALDPDQSLYSVNIRFKVKCDAIHKYILIMVLKCLFSFYYWYPCFFCTHHSPGAETEGLHPEISPSQWGTDPYCQWTQRTVLSVRLSVFLIVGQCPSEEEEEDQCYQALHQPSDPFRFKLFYSEQSHVVSGFWSNPLIGVCSVLMKHSWAKEAQAVLSLTFK